MERTPLMMPATVRGCVRCQSCPCFPRFGHRKHFQRKYLHIHPQFLRQMQRIIQFKLRLEFGFHIAGDRPGMRALSELSVLSPLRECGLTKEQIRQLSKEAGLFTWDKPAYACLAPPVPSPDAAHHPIQIAAGIRISHSRLLLYLHILPLHKEDKQNPHRRKKR